MWCAYGCGGLLKVPEASVVLSKWTSRCFLQFLTVIGFDITVINILIKYIFFLNGTPESSGWIIDLGLGSLDILFNVATQS